MILTTERLLLRPMEQGDAPALFAILGDPEAMAFWDRPAMTRLAVAEESVREQIAAMADGLCLYWTVLEDGAVIGSCDLSLIDHGAKTAETGFLFRRACWGQGYATEAMTAVTAQGLGPLGLTRLSARIHAGNVRAQRLLVRLGFSLEDILPGHVLPSGARVDCELYFRRSPSRSRNGA